MPSSEDLVLRRARLGLTDALTDLVVRDGRVDVADAPAPVPRGEEIDLDGRTVLPGLWDHHVHADHLALRSHWLDLEGTDGPDAVVARAAALLAAEAPEPGLPLVGCGFRDALWSRAPHRNDLDRVSSTVPVVMVSADIHQGWLNTAALRAYGWPEDHDGLIREHDWFPVLERICRLPDDLIDRWAAETLHRAATRGVVGVVDFENAEPLERWARRHAREPLAARVQVGVWPQHLPSVIAAGLRSGDPIPGGGGLAAVGRLKVISDGSLNTQTAYCHDPYPGDPSAYGVLSVPPEELRPLMARAWAGGIGSSIHAIGDHANELVLDAFADVGCTGTVEHAQLLTDRDLARFASLGVAASIQPEHAHDDRDIADVLWAGRTGRSFAYGSLHRHGARLLLGSDAPVAPLDPLLTLGAAVSRSRDGRPAWHPEQELPLSVALAASTGTGRTEPRTGDLADLAIVDLDLRTADASALRTAHVAGTLLGGRWTHRDGL